MKRRRITVALLLLCIVFTMLGTTTAEAKSSGYKSAYLKLVKQFNKKYPQSTYSKNRYSLVYIDTDRIPELVCDRRGYYLSIYTYKNGKTYCLTRISSKYLNLDRWAYGAGGNIGYYYLPKKNKVFNRNYDNEANAYTDTIWKIKKGRFKTVQSKYYNSNIGSFTYGKYKSLNGTKTLSQIKKLLK